MSVEVKLINGLIDKGLCGVNLHKVTCLKFKFVHKKILREF